MNANAFANFNSMYSSFSRLLRHQISVRYEFFGGHTSSSPKVLRSGMCVHLYITEVLLLVLLRSALINDSKKAETDRLMMQTSLSLLFIHSNSALSRQLLTKFVIAKIRRFIHVHGSEQPLSILLRSALVCLMIYD